MSGRACSVTVATPTAAGGQPSRHGGARTPDPSAATAPGAQTVSRRPRDAAHLPRSPTRFGSGTGRLPTWGGGGDHGKGRGLRRPRGDLRGLARAIREGFPKEEGVSPTSAPPVPRFVWCLPSSCLTSSQVRVFENTVSASLLEMESGSHLSQIAGGRRKHAGGKQNVVGSSSEASAQPSPPALCLRGGEGEARKG